MRTTWGQARSRIASSFPYAVVRRFFELELLDRNFAMAAQAFVALLPIEIVIVSLVYSDGPEVMANAIGNRFGLDALARLAVQHLFAPSGTKAAFSWLAVVVALFSAFSLSRRLARVYASIFEVAPLRGSQSWRGLVWIGIQVTLFIVASVVRDFRRDEGIGFALLGTLMLMALWIVTDIASLRLLVPRAAMRLVVATAFTAAVGRLALGVWALLYMSDALNRHAAQYGPIGLTFLIFTYLLAAVLVYTGAPLLVTTWVAWRQGRQATTAGVEA